MDKIDLIEEFIGNSDDKNTDSMKANYEKYCAENQISKADHNAFKKNWMEYMADNPSFPIGWRTAFILNESFNFTT